MNILSLGFCHRPAFFAPSQLLVLDPIPDERFELGAEVADVERLLKDDRGLLVGAGFAVPSKSVYRIVRTNALDDDADCVREPDGVVRRVAWQKKHLPFPNVNIPELASIDDTQQHCTLVLIEPFLGLIYMIVIALVRSANCHNDVVLPGVQAKIVDGRLQFVRILG